MTDQRARRFLVNIGATRTSNFDKAGLPHTVCHERQAPSTRYSQMGYAILDLRISLLQT